MNAPQKPQAPPAVPARTDYRRLVERDYLGQWDLQRPDGRYIDAVVQIASIKRYVPRERRKKKVGEDPQGKPVYELEKIKRLHIEFVGKRKAWLAGPTSQDVLAGLFGRYIEDWVGKRISIYVDAGVKMKGKTVGGIRVRPRSPDANAPMTDDPLDNEVDEQRAQELAEAYEEFADDEEPASP
jgi:hypothetical protein